VTDDRETTPCSGFMSGLPIDRDRRIRACVPGALVVLVVCSLFVSRAHGAGGSSSAEPEDFEDLDLEDLLNTSVTSIDQVLDEVFSASRHKQSIADSPSAITVITELRSRTALRDIPCLRARCPR